VKPYVGATPFVRWGNWPLVAGLFLIVTIVGLFRFNSGGKKPA
jgi:apolipoprotein N-acyltransferase